jgi:acyl-CoA synthetase (AMP-forming)/AMP-acid ligase II
VKASIAGRAARPLSSEVQAARAVLRSAGAAPGTRVLVTSANSVELVAVLIALVLEDCSIVLIDSGADRRLLEQVMSQSRPAIVWGTPPGPVDCTVIDPLEAHPVDSRSSIDILPSPTGPDASSWRARSDALILFTSGTSGLPKGVVRSGASVMDNMEATCEAMGYREHDVMLPLLPFTHQYGFSIVLLAWATQCSLVVANPVRAVESLRSAEEVGTVTVVDAAPSHYATLIAARLQEPTLGRDVRMWCVGGAPVNAHLRDRARTVLGSELLDGYGMTELGNVTLATLQSTQGAGRPISGVRVHVVDPLDWTARCAVGEWGRVIVASAHAFHSYVSGEPGAARSEWFDTGDTGFFDADGCLHVVGRDGAVHRNGNTLHLAGIERQLEMSGLTCVLTALPAEGAETRLIAYVLGDDATRIKRRVRASLPRLAWPNRVVVLSSFPMLHNGKIDRGALNAMSDA